MDDLRKPVFIIYYTKPSPTPTIDLIYDVMCLGGKISQAPQAFKK